MDKCELQHELKENSMQTTRSSTKGNKYSYSNPKIKSNKDQSARVTGFQKSKGQKSSEPRGNSQDRQISPSTNT